MTHGHTAQMQPDDSEAVPSLSSLIPDQALRAMIEEAPEKLCQLIVEADLPKRRFSLERRNSGQLVKKSETGAAHERETILAQVASELQTIAGPKQTNVLKSSGAVVVQVPAKRMKDVSRVPHVKVIRLNRKLKR